MTDLNASPLSRRVMLRAAALAGGAFAASSLFDAPVHAADAKVGPLKKGATVLIQGDSITDAGRNRGAQGPNDANGLGRGYPFMLGSYFLATQPYDELRVYNRGISGNKVPDLDARWEDDCIKLKPDLLTILIGVNDIWHKLAGRYDGTVESYEKGYTALLERTKKALPDVRIVVCEPFVLHCGAINDKWFPEFDERRAAAKRVSTAAGAIWVPFQSMFDEAAKHAPPNYWAGDGVHPTMAGHALMTATWIDTVMGG